MQHLCGFPKESSPKSVKDQFDVPRKQQSALKIICGEKIPVARIQLEVLATCNLRMEVEK